MKTTITSMSGNYVKLLLSSSLLLIAVGRCAMFGGGTELQRANQYQIQPPSGWAKTDKAESDHAFRSRGGNFATVTSSCNRNPDAPLEVLTRHLLIGERRYSIVDKKSLQVDGAPALLSRVKVNEGKKPIGLLLLVLSKGGCIFDFSLISPNNISESEEKDFLAFVQSFKYGKN